MSDRASLVAAVAAAPDDDLPKLVFADWLDENGEPERAEFIRLSVAHARELTAFPPAPDPDKAARLGELFLANHRAWLRPVYEPLGLPVPHFTPPPRDRRGDFPLGDRWNVGSMGGLVVGQAMDQPLHMCLFQGGVVASLGLHPDRLSPTATPAPAFAAEPISRLNLVLPPHVDVWQRLDGPHLRRVSSFSLTFGRIPRTPTLPPQELDADADFRPLIAAILGSEHLGGVRGLTFGGGREGSRASPGAHLFEALRGSPLRHQLTTLTLVGLPGMGHLLSRSDHGFDALHKLSLMAGVMPGAADELFAAGIDDTIRRRLTWLAVPVSAAHGLAWLTAGPAWERLGTLSLHGSGLAGAGVGDTGATTLAAATTLPALRELRLHGANITDAGAIALARAPWVANLNALVLDMNPVGDDGAVELALALDRGLKYLSLRHTQTPVALRTRQALTARYGPRIAFDFTPLR